MQTAIEALYDGFLAAKGDPVLWITDGAPSQYWGQCAVDLVSSKGVAVSTSRSNDEMIRIALGEVSRRVYGLDIGEIIKNLKTKQQSLLNWMKEHKGLLATIALIGADIALDVGSQKILRV